MPSRRTVLRGAALAAVGVPLAGLSTRQAASAASRLPIKIVNHTNRNPNSTIWAYIVGTAPSGRQCYVRADGTLVEVSTSLNGADGFADLSIPMVADGDTTVSLPNMSGRIYFSLDTKLKFKVVTDGNGNAALQYPAGWVTSDPSYNVLHDCMEFTFNSSGMFCNTTMVDMFSIPLAINLVGQANQTTGTLVSGGRAAIFAGIAAQPDFSRLVVGNNLRVIAPGHGIEAGLFASTYYDSYVNDVWSHYAGTDLRVKINSTTYTGRVSGNNLVFNNGAAAFAKPSTKDIFYCNGALSAPNDGVTGPVAADLGAAFNRSTLLSYADQPVTDPSLYYQPAITNHYSQVIHANTVDGKAYGFPFDDVNSFASYIQDGAPTSLAITLTSFTGASTGGGTATLLSANKPATSSSNENAGYPASYAVDGNGASRWSSAFADPQWLQVDLGANHSISRAVLTWEVAYGKAYQLQTSTDGSTWQTAYSTTTGDGGVDDVSFAAVNARYVRMYGTTRGTPYGYSLWEFAVYGS
jgi:Beta-1,3-glucanase/F5/8 type C domain